ncbi:hypothetical protein [Rhodococcoides fascians]|uniref:hypothetical protein n=1 Tax=Rhodococcoides fascians TaxID=1828 RepID=UPI00113FF79D|nr:MULTISPECIES: hypothetical protein [Rhodococcus]
MTKYGYRLHAVELHLGMKHQLQKFGAAEIPLADGSSGSKVIDYRTTAASDATAAIGRAATFGLTQETESGTGPAHGRAASMRFSGAEVVNDAVRLHLEHGVLNLDGTVIDPRDETAVDVPLRDKSTLHPYRAVLIAERDATRGLLAVETRGQSCPIVSVVRGLNHFSKDKWRLRVRAHLAGEAAMLKFIRSASIDRVQFEKFGFDGDGAKQRREVSMSVYTSLEGELIREQALEWVRDGYQRVRSRLGDPEVEAANSDEAPTETQSQPPKRSREEWNAERKAVSRAKREQKVREARDARKAKTVIEAEAADELRRAIFVNRDEDVRIEFNSVGVEMSNGEESRTINPTSDFNRYTYPLGRSVVSDDVFWIKAEATARELLPLLAGLDLD